MMWLVANFFSEKYPRIKIFPRKGTQKWNDQQLMVYDSFERMSGYGYFGIIDHDEFFRPTKHKTLKEMLVITQYKVELQRLEH